MMPVENYLIIPGTNKKLYVGSVVILYRLPNLQWILHCGFYNYNGQRQKGWYFSSIPSDTTMPVYSEDLVNIKVIDSPCPPIPPCPCPPIPPSPPEPPAPIPTVFTPEDKKHLDAAMLTVDTIADRDALGTEGIQDGKIVRVNDSDGEGTLEYYSWNADENKWELAPLGYRYMTREEVIHAIGDSIVSIVWSNEDGALVITNNNGDISETSLLGVAHDPIYCPEQLVIRIPIYGKEDFVVALPQGMYIVGIRFEHEWHFDEPEPHVGPAIVITVSDGTTETDIAGDASGMINVFSGQETATARVIVENALGQISANVKLSSIANNPLQIDNEGLWVDLSGVVGKRQIDAGLLLVADGQGGFTYAGTGIEVETTTAIADLTHPEKKVVTANLIADAISAAITAISSVLENRISILENRVTNIESRIDFGEGADGELLSSDGNGLARSGYSVGGSTLDTSSNTTVATEQAITAAFSWREV